MVDSPNNAVTHPEAGAAAVTATAEAIDDLDQRMDARLSIDMADANVVVTDNDADGDPRGLRTRLIELTGANTATRTLTLPDTAGGWWFIYNNTTGGQSVTVEADTAGATVSVPNGEVRTVFVNLNSSVYDVRELASSGGGSVAVQVDDVEETAAASTLNFLNWPGQIADDGSGNVDIDYLGGFAVEQLPNIHAWYDFSDAGSISTTGNLIDQINDKSGNGNHATGSGASRPDSGTMTINSLNVGDFASAEFLQVPWVGASALDLTAVVVFQTTEAGSNADWFNSPMILGDEIAGSVNDFGLVMNGGNLSFVVTNSGQNNSTSTWNDGNPHGAIVDRVKADGSGEFFVDGSSDGAFTTNTATIDAVGSTIGLGADEDGNANRQWAGQIAEVVILYGLLTTGERQQLEGYLAHKWGYEANLPAGHPYKVAAPPNAQTVPEVVGSVEGTFSASQVLLRYVANKPLQYPANLLNSAVELGVATTGTPTFTVEKNGSQVGDFSFAASATTPTFGSNPAFSLAAGDVLTVTAPATPDGTAADIAINLAAFGGNATSVSSFLELPDTPSSYNGQAGKLAAVNSAETAIELVEARTLTAQRPAIVYNQSVSSVSSQDITDIDPQAGETYVLELTGIDVSADDAYMQLQVSDDNGSTFESTSYHFVGRSMSDLQAGNTSGEVYQDAAASALALVNDEGGGWGISNSANESGDIRVDLGELATSGLYKNIAWRGGHVGGSNQAVMDWGAGHWAGGTGAINALRVLVSSGTFSGNIKLVRISQSSGLENTVATTSGTAVAISTAISDDINVIELTLDGVSTNTANQPPIFQLGDAGGYENTGYASITDNVAGSAANETSHTDGFYANRTADFAAADVLSGIVRLTRFPGTNKWMVEGTIHSDAGHVSRLSGVKETSAATDSIQVTTPGGTATFDAGSIGYRLLSR